MTMSNVTHGPGLPVLPLCDGNIYVCMCVCVAAGDRSEHADCLSHAH